MLLGFFWEKRSHLAELNKLNNALVDAQQMVKVTEGVVASKAYEIENLKSQNSDLQKIIKKNKEEILALADIAVQYKDRYLEIKNANQSVVDQAGSQSSSLSTECTECIAKTRIKVDFDESKDDLRVYGYTLTSPAKAYINLQWLQPLKLQLVLTKAEDGTFKIYLDDQNKVVVPTALTLKVDPSVLERKWFEKIAFGADVGASQFGINASIRAMYGIKNNLYIGPAVSLSMMFTGQIAPFYGASVLWMPFMRNP